MGRQSDESEDSAILRDKAARIERQAKIYQFNREKDRADREFARLPYWVQWAAEGDYMSDGSDMQPYEPDERK